MESNLDPDEESNLDPDGAESVAELVYSELGLSQELVDLRVREDMGEEVYVLKHSHSSQQCPGGAQVQILRHFHTTSKSTVICASSDQLEICFYSLHQSKLKYN